VALVEAIQSNAVLFYGVVAFLGLFIGSFLNVVIYRLPVMMHNEWQEAMQEMAADSTPSTATDTTADATHSEPFNLSVPRSRCPKCSNLITWWQNIPVLSYLMWIGLLAALIPVFTDLRSAVIGAAAGYLVLWLVYQLFKLITGKEGMGYGDFKLLAALGALLGWQQLPVIILLSSLVGAVVGLSLIAITGRDKNIPIPFGPYLAAAGWIAMLWGEKLTDAYLGTFG